MPCHKHSEMASQLGVAASALATRVAGAALLLQSALDIARTLGSARRSPCACRHSRGAARWSQTKDAVFVSSGTSEYN